LGINSWQRIDHGKREKTLPLPPTYSIVIPAYNESARLGATLKSVLSYVHSQGWDAEVIVVNDGSRDNTAEIVRSFAAADPILRLVENPGNRGKGYSVRNVLSDRGSPEIVRGPGRRRGHRHRLSLAPC
jgi:glycosyltransferase involved in cell wall biosynthesis